ncbi:MAG: hypothetical protein J7K17_01635 [Candidatus Omnitrophica bacterium]|nr:hypothetical protein [Candidatus Omnitrophota bacterium]
MRRFTFFFFLLIIFSFFNLFAQNQFTITTYYPTPYGIYNEVKVKEKIIVGNKPPFGSELPSGIIYTERIVLKKWVDSYPENPVDGELIYYYDSRKKRKKLMIYKGGNLKKWKELPTFITQKIYVKIDTSLRDLYICGKKAKKGEWTECILRPGVTDTFGGCKRASLNRTCTTKDCTLTLSGSEYYSLNEKVWIKVPDRKSYELFCQSRKNTFDGHCNAPLKVSCSWIKIDNSDTAYAHFQSNCSGCPAWCGCGRGRFYLKYTSP